MTTVAGGFNPRPREGSDPSQSPPPQGWPGFNPRPREGSDSYRHNVTTVAGCFNPRPREGSDSTEEGGRGPPSVFQSAPPRRERRLSKASQRPSSRFNPRPREGSDEFLAPTGILSDVSIRAPAKGATTARANKAASKKFQSAPPRRERLLLCVKTAEFVGFQSAPPRRERPKPNLT